MTEREEHLLVMELCTTTPFGRLSHPECHAVFDRMKELGYTVAAPQARLEGSEA